ncbi:MAG: mechanosensitive ion channel family protein [Nanoarchaeota archaeon]
MLEMVYSNPYVIFLAMVVGSVIAARIVYFILDKWVHLLTRKTKTDLDDIILDNTKGPTYVILIAAGVYHAIRTLPFIDPYMGYVKGVFFIIAVITAAWIIQRIVNILIPRWLVVSKSFEKTPKILSRVINGAVYFIGMLIILDHFDVAITPLVTTLGIGGIAVGLALQDTLSNFFAGVHLISDKPIQMGDFIEVECADAARITGYVDDIGWRSTKIRTLQENIVIIPNAKLSQSVITNSSMPRPALWFSVPCGVSYEMDLDKVEKIALEAADHIKKNVKGVPKGFDPAIRFNSFGDSNINFNINMQAETFSDKFLITHELIKEVKRRFDKSRVEISYPVRKIVQARR